MIINSIYFGCQVVGAGAFGKVYLVIRKDSGKEASMVWFFLNGLHIEYA